MLKICLLRLQIKEYLNESYPLVCIKNILESLTFMEKFYLWDQRKISPFYFSFPFHYCQLLCIPMSASKPCSTCNISTVFFVGIIKIIIYLWRKIYLLTPKYLIVRSTKLVVIFRVNTLR